MELDPRKINAKIVNYTARNSRYETSRSYVSLSNIYLSVEDLINQYKNGFADSIPIRLKCYKGYQMEDDILNRLGSIFGDLKTDIEINIHHGLIQGHPDFSLYDHPGDCKSVLKDDWIPKPGKLPRKVYWQMQGYMLYLKKKKSLVIYESRENGYLKTFLVYENHRIQSEISMKINEIINELG